jgi:hypothetical protein
MGIAAPYRQVRFERAEAYVTLKYAGPVGTGEMKKTRSKAQTPVGPGRWNLRLYEISERAGPRARRYEVRSPEDDLVALCRIKRGEPETISVFADEDEETELMRLEPKTLRQYAAAYDVHDSVAGKTIGEFRKKVYRPLRKSEWFIFNAEGDPLGMVTESAANSGFLGRLLPLPGSRTKSFDVHWGQSIAGRISRKGLFGMEKTELDLSLDKRQEIDRRLAIGVAVLVRDHERNGEAKDKTAKESSKASADGRKS